MYTKPATVARDKPLRISMIDDPVWRSASTSKSVEPQMRAMSALELAQHEVKGYRYLKVTSRVCWLQGDLARICSWTPRSKAERYWLWT